MLDRVRAWLDRWGAIIPLLIAEFIVWLGFGGLLPVMPIYFADQGVDLGTLGLVIAAWPAARLVSEPIFGWLADRTARVPLMVIGLVATGVFGALPLVWTGPVAFFLLRAGAGLGAAIYDPAARGFLTDATPQDRRGEAFGLYGAAQMGGLLLGPTIGAIGAEHFGGIAFVFVFAFHGASYLTLRTAGDLCERARRAARALAIPAVVVGGGYLVWTVAVAVDRNDKDVFPPALPAAIAIAAFLVAAFLVSVIVFGVVDLTGIGDNPIRVLIAPLATFLPGGVITIATVELAAGEIISGASRLVNGFVQLLLLAFGIIAAASLVGIDHEALADYPVDRLGWWAPWLGVILIAAGDYLHYAAPLRAVPWIFLVLVVAYAGA